jgi:hypothetical protein
LHWRVDAVWKQRARLCATGGKFAIVRPMFGHNERLRLGQIKHLTGAMANARFRVCRMESCRIPRVKKEAQLLMD